MDRTRLELNDFTGYTFLSGLTWAPDGGCAAFIARRANEKGDGYDADLYLLDAQGTLRRMTSAGDCRSFFFKSAREIWFPAARKQADRDRIAAGEPLTVWQRLCLDGGEASEALRLPLSVGSVKPMADGRLAVLAEHDLRVGDFYAMDDAQRADVLAHQKDEHDYKVLEEIPFWFNGRGFIDNKRSRLMIVDPATGAITPVSEPQMNVEDFDVCGTQVLFSGQTYDAKAPVTSSVSLYDTASGETRELLPGDVLGVGDVFFWDGEPCFFATDMKAYGGNQNPALFAAREGGITQLFLRDEAPGSNVGSDCRLGGGRTLAVEGESLYYTVADHTDTKLLRLTKDGHAETLISGEGSVDGFDVHDGRVIAVAMRGLRLQEVYALEDGALVQRTSFNEAVFTGKTLSTPEAMQIVSDGVTIEGFVMKPVGFDPEKTYPAVLDIHGGPKTAFGSVFFHEMQVWANLGYFVFYCNPRGGDGRGDAFADIRGKYGTIDYDDLMRFTDAVLSAFPQIDPARVGVTGGSYGGFMTNWIIGHTDRFAAAASLRSIANWISKSNTTDIGYTFNADQMLCTAWSDFEKMWFHSPLKYADRCTTPTLFIHSDEDYRCWMAEGLQMYTALKVHGCEARLCLFHGENHELSRSGKPKHRERRLREITDWFDSHLK